MKRVLRTVCLTMLVVVLTFGLVVPVAKAEETKLVTASIPVTIQRKGNTIPETDTIQVDIAPITQGAPMPAQSHMEIVCTGSKTEAFFSIDYTQRGVYQYKVTIHEGDYYLGIYGGDRSFTVTVAVTNKPDYSGIQVEIGAKEEGSSEKSPMVYEINYLDPMEILVVKKWIDQASSRPTHITVDLILDGEVVESRRVRAADGWQTSFGGLDPRLQYSIQEHKVPGYAATYKTDQKENIWYIYNTGSLLQTGQTLWPIPVLIFLGAGLIGLGIVLLRRKEEREDG